MHFEEQNMKIYSNEYGYYTRLARKNVTTDSWENAFVYVQFKKGVSVEHKTEINVKKSWLSFYKNKEGKVVFYIFISDFDVIGHIEEVEETDTNE